MKVFLSHAAGSKELAEELARALAARGAPATLAMEEIVPQGAWLQALDRELRGAAAVVLLIEPQARSREEERPAWSAVLEAFWDDPNKKLIGVLIDDAEVPPFLAGAPAIRIRSDAFDAAALAGDILSLAQPGESGPPPEDETEKSRQRERLENIATTARALHPVQRSRELRVLLVCPNDDLARSLTDVIQKSRLLSVAARFSTYPSPSQLLGDIARLEPTIIAIDYVSQLQAAIDLTRWIAKAEPSKQIFAIQNSADPETILNAMRAGAHEFLYEPFTAEMLSAVAGRVIRVSAEAGRSGAFGTVIAFLGVKAGAGASTLAVNTAGAISEAGKRTLLLDLDLQGGTVGFQLKRSKTTYSVRDAIARSDSLDEDLWRALVHNRSARLDFLPASSEWGSPAVEPDRIRGLLDSARTAYEVVIADLPAATDYISAAALASCDRAVVACLTDMTSLWLTLNGLAYLEGIGLALNRCSVVLNRADKRNSEMAEGLLEKLKRPVQFVFPEDKSAVEDALTAGGFVSRNASLGREIRRFADHLIGVQPQERRPKASFARSLLRWT